MFSIVEAMTVRSTVLLRLDRTEFNKQIIPYIERRNQDMLLSMQKSRYFQHWPQPLMHDIACNAQIIRLTKGSLLYSKQDQPQFIYIVKQGIVLLQRTTAILNQQFASYQHDHDMNLSGETENTLVVRKGMVFGIDGIVVKQGRGRLYYARAMGNCEVYVVKGELVMAVEGGQQMQDEYEVHRPELLISTETPQPLTSKANSLPMLQPIKYKPFLKIRAVCPDLRTPPNSVEPEKRENVRLVHRMEERVRKLSVKSLAAKRSNKSCLDGSCLVENQNPEKTGKSTQERMKNPVEYHISKALSKEKETVKKMEYLNFRTKVHESLKRPGPPVPPNLCFSIKSYRNVLPSSFKSVTKP